MLSPIQREHLELIRKQAAGSLRPRDVLADARNPNSPLHGLFLWNDSEAAEAYRLIQARDVVRVAVRILPRAPVEPTRAVVSIQPRGPGRPAQVMPPLPIQGDVEREFLADLNDLLETYSRNAELSGILFDIRSARDRWLKPKPHFPGADRAQGGTMRRFEMKPYTHGEAHASKETAPLRADHPALTEARTQFPSRAFDAADADHVLISGHNNAKIGAFVAKGPWAGMEIYTLTLEERATCPTECHLWSECYGNAMPLAKRWKYEPALMERLDVEIGEKAREHAAGFVVRLHVLGDFPDLDYVARWRDWLDTFKTLHVFGYTAHPRFGLIGQSIADLNRDYPNRCAIRFSVAPETEPQPMQATAIWRREAGKVPEGIVCPASSGDTACCGTCGLCWSPAFADKRVVFLGHGMNRTQGGRTPGVETEAKGISDADTPDEAPNGLPLTFPKHEPEVNLKVNAPPKSPIPPPPQRKEAGGSTPIQAPQPKISRMEALVRVSTAAAQPRIALQPSQERTRDGARSIVATQLREEAAASESAPATRQDIIAWASANKVRFADGKVSLSVVNNARLGFGLPPFRLVAG